MYYIWDRNGHPCKHPTWGHLQSPCSLMRPSFCRNARSLMLFPIDLAILIGSPTQLYTARNTMVNGNMFFSTFRRKEWPPTSASCPTATNVTAFCVKSHLIFGTRDFWPPTGPTDELLVTQNVLPTSEPPIHHAQETALTQRRAYVRTH